MGRFLQQVVDGLAAGSIYASLGLALVFVFRATGLVNFAQGELAMFSTYMAWEFRHDGLPIWAAIVVSVTISIGLGGFLERVVIRPASGGPPLTPVVVTLGLLLLINSTAGWLWTFGLRIFPSPFPSRVVTAGRVRLSVQSLGTVAVLAVLCLALTGLFRFTRVGLAMRAVASNRESSRLAGVGTSRLLMLGWGLAAALGALSGVMVAPKLFLEPNMMAGVLIYAFAAATLGGFTNPVGTVAGGLAIGVLENLAGTYVPGVRSDLKIVVPLAVIFLVVLVRPQGLFGKTGVRRAPRQSSAPVTGGRAPRPALLAMSGASRLAARLAGAAAGIALVLAIPFLAQPFQLFRISLTMVWVVAVLSLTLLIGQAGQISLGHSVFFAVGAYTSALLITRAHWPGELTIPVAGALAFAAGYAFGIPALRLTGFQLALVTLALAVVMPPVIKRFAGLTGGSQGFSFARAGAPHWTGLTVDQWLYFVCLVTGGLAFAVARNLTRGRIGRAIVAIRDDAVAAEASGVWLTTHQTATFAWSAGIAGVAGALYALVVNYVSPESFTSSMSVTLVAGAVVGGTSALWGAVLGGLFVQNVPVAAAHLNGALSGVITGVALIVLMVPGGGAGLLRKLRRRLVADPEGPVPVRRPPRRRRAPTGAFELHDI